MWTVEHFETKRGTYESSKQWSFLHFKVLNSCFYKCLFSLIFMPKTLWSSFTLSLKRRWTFFILSFLKPQANATSSLKTRMIFQFSFWCGLLSIFTLRGAHLRPVRNGSSSISKHEIHVFIGAYSCEFFMQKTWAWPALKI